jgi:hypothetical protein
VAPANRSPLDLDDIRDHALTGRGDPDSETSREAEDFDRQERAARISGTRQNIAERKKYAGRIFFLLSCWLGGVFVILLLQGFLSPWRIFGIDRSVLLAVIGGTTLNVIGIFVVVVRYLFPGRSD